LPQVNQEVLLKVIAQVADAVSGLERVREEVRLLVGEVKANSPVQFELQISEDLARLGELRIAFENTLATLRQGSTTGIKIDLSGIEAQLRDLAAHVKAGVDQIKDSFAGLGKIKPQAPPLAAKLSEEFKKFQSELGKLESQFKGAVSRLNTASRGVTFDPISRSATLARDRVRIAAENMVEFLSKIPPATEKDAAAFAALQARIEALRAEAAKFAQIQVVPPGGIPAASGLTESLGRLGSAFSVASTFAQLFFASLIVQKIEQLGAAVVGTASKVQSLQLRFASFLGSASAGNEQLAHLRQLADDLGLSYLTLAERFGTYSVAAKAANLSSEETRDIFDAVATGAAGLGASAEDLSGILLAFDQILEKGHVQREELIKQLANRGVPAFQLLSKGIGVTTKELEGLLKDGLLPASVAVPALAAEMLKFFGPAAVDQARTYRAEQERFGNAITDLETKVGGELLPALSDLLQSLKSIGREGADGFASIGRAASGAIGSVGALLRIFGDLKNLRFDDLITELRGIQLDRLVEGGKLGSLAFKGLTLNAKIYAGELHSLGLISDETFAKIADAFRKGQEAADGSVKDLEKHRDALRADTEEGRRNAEEAKRRAEEIARANEEKRDRLVRAAHDAAVKQREEAEELTKKERAELLKREGQFFEHLKKLADLSRDPNLRPLDPFTGNIADAPVVAGPTVKAGDSSELVKLKAELDAAREAKRLLSLQPSTSPEDTTQIEALGAQIRDLEDKIRSLATSSTAATAQVSQSFSQTAASVGQSTASISQQLSVRVLKSLDELINGSDGFVKAFQQVGPAARDGITQAISSLEQFAHSGDLTREALAVFGRQLVDSFKEGGLVGEAFAAQLDAAFGNVQGSATSLAGQLQALSDRTLPLVGDKAIDLAARLEQLGGGAEKTSANFIQAHGSSTQLRDGLFSVGEEAKEVTAKTQVMDEVIAQAKQNFIGLHGEGGKLGENLLKVGEGATKATEGAEKLAATPPPKNLAEGLDQTAKAAEGVKTPLEAVAAAAEKVGTAGQAESVGKLGTALSTVSGPAAAVSAPLGQVAESASRLAESVAKLIGEPGLGTVAAQLTPLLAPLQQLAEPATRLATALSDLGRATQTIKPEGINALAESGTKLAAIVEPAGQAVAALEPVVDVARSLGVNFGTLNTNAANVATQLGAIGTAAAALVTAVSDPALAAGLDTLGASLAGAAPNLAAVANDVDRLSKSLDATKAAIPEVAKGIDEIAKSVAAPEVKAGLGSLALAIEKIEKGATGAATGLKSVGDSLGGISSTATKAASGLGELVKAIDVKKIQSGADAVGRLGATSATAATASANLATAAEDVRENVSAAVTKLDAAKASIAGMATEATKAGPIVRQQLASAFATFQVQSAKVREDLDAIKKDLQDIGTVGAGQLSAAAAEASGLAAALREVASAAGAAKAGLAGVKFPTVSSGR
jgi:tape measure domain-containing protein